jgi:hypothetical protein
MNNLNNHGQPMPLLKAIKSFFNKLVKTQEEYPIKYYKKTKHTHKNDELHTT